MHNGIRGTGNERTQTTDVIDSPMWFLYYNIRITIFDLRYKND